ncbi:MAG: exo-alpha-sialidase [Phycisphaeraceae bacterium]|nr:exo-alpha-sialidase [Phycisphaeraceae bacterium]
MAVRADDFVDLALQPATVLLDPPVDQYGSKTREFECVPGIERASNGRLWATWYAGGTDEGPENYVVLATSEDDGRTWSKPVLVIAPTPPVRAFDEAIWIDPEGRMWLFWAQAYTWWDGRAGVWAITTDNPQDAKPTWSEPRRLCNGIMLNKPIVTRNGDWLAPVAVWKRTIKKDPPLIIDDTRFCHDLPDEQYSNVYRSRDRGQTWQRIGYADEPDRSYDEHVLVERKDGSLWMLIRTSAARMGQSFSHDGGVTWSRCYPSWWPSDPPRIEHTDSRFFVRRLNSGNLLLVRHNPPGDLRGRYSLTAFLSEDDGQTWTGGLLLDERFSAAYPDGVQAPDGTIYVI